MSDTINATLVVDRPSGSPVVRDYLAGEARALGFYGRHFAAPDAFSLKAAEVDGRFDRAARERAARAVIVPEGGDPGRLERFVEEGGYMVTTGQQPGLFGGPLYSLYKALTAVTLAARCEAGLGRPVLPLFWVASEDHDWAEANHADVLDLENEERHFELPARDPGSAPPLHRIPMGPAVTHLIDELQGALPASDFSGPYLELIRATHRPEATLPEAFHGTLQALLGRFGLFFTDAAHPEVKAGSREVLLSELDRAEAMEELLRATATKLEASGYALQVPILEGGVNLFLEGPGGRERLYREDGAFRLRTSGRALGSDEVRAAVTEDPLVLSPNVLLRPVVESALFPTLSYVGGPGEMAYFAQLGAYFAAHGIEMPVVMPRNSVTVLERKVQKVLEKFGVSVSDLDRPFHEIAGEAARDEVPEDVRAALGTLRGAIGAGAGALQQATRAVDPTLKGSVAHMRSQAFAAVDELEKKVVTAVKRETDIALAQLQKAQLNLFPRGKPAERVLSPFYFLARYGDGFLDALHEQFAMNLD